jgi:NAD(P)H-hydrate repair Nnr-like enzyme with NAD(P)H-hydrate epimerase domain
VIAPGAVLSRQEIARRLGGSIRPFLPEVAGRAVATCIDPRLNPEAPELVLIGAGPRTLAAARRFARSGHAVPLFLRLGPHRWWHAGTWRAAALIEGAALIARHAAHRRDRIAAVMRLAQPSG